MPHPRPPSLDRHEGPQNGGRNDDIPPKEGTHAVGEKLGEEQLEIEAMLPDEGDKLGLGEQRAGDAEREGEALRAHVRILSCSGWLPTTAGQTLRDPSVPYRNTSPPTRAPHPHYTTAHTPPPT